MTKQRTLPLVFVLLLLGALVFAPSVAAQEGLPQPVAVGSNTAGQVTLEVPSLRYVLVGNGGDSVAIQVLGLTPGFAPRFSVSNAASEVVLDVANPAGEANVSGEVLLATTGAYIIEVSGEQGNGGQFVLALQPGVPPPEPVVLVLGEPVTATAGGESPLLIFRFNSEGLAGQTLAIVSDLPDSGPAYSIIDEATGGIIASSDGSLAGGTLKLGAANTAYTIEIRPGSGGGATPFTICLGCGESPAPEATEAPALAEEPPAPTTTPAPTATVEVCNVVSSIAGAINARSGPGTAYSMVGAIRAGEAFPALAQTEDGAWLMFDLRGRDAWVSSAVARLEGGCDALLVVGAGGAVAITRTPVASAAGNCTIVSTYNGNANVRIGPSENFNLLGSFTRGQTAPAQAQTSDGAWFMYDRSGVDAWVSSAVARLDGDCAGLPSVAPVGAPAGNAAAAPPAGNGQPNTVPSVPAGNNAVPTTIPAATGAGSSAGAPPVTGGGSSAGVPPVTGPGSSAGGPPVTGAGSSAGGPPVTGAGSSAGGPPVTGAGSSAGGQSSADAPPAVPNAVAPVGNSGSQGSGSTVAAPDLIAEGELFIDDTVIPNRMMWYGSAFNNGNAPTGPWQIRLCAGNTCEQHPMTSLEPRSGDGQWLVYPIGQGVLTHAVIVDSTNIVAESNENNNTLSQNIGPESAASWAAEQGIAPAVGGDPAQAQGQPDLVITGVELRNETEAAYRINVTNVGTTMSNATTLQFCVYECLIINIPELAPNESRALRYPFVPQGTEISFQALVDSNNVVAESNENNNAFTGADILTP